MNREKPPLLVSLPARPGIDTSGKSCGSICCPPPPSARLSSGPLLSPHSDPSRGSAFTLTGVGWAGLAGWAERVQVGGERREGGRTVRPGGGGLNFLASCLLGAWVKPFIFSSSATERTNNYSIVKGRLAIREQFIK